MTVDFGLGTTNTKAVTTVILDTFKKLTDWRWISMRKIRKTSLLKYKSLLKVDVDVDEGQKVFSVLINLWWKPF